jgi:hypothetical protein
VIESFMAGVTGLLGRWGIHLNHVNRFRPYRIMLGQGHAEQTLLFGFGWNGLPHRR